MNVPLHPVLVKLSGRRVYAITRIPSRIPIQPYRTIRFVSTPAIRSVWMFSDLPRLFAGEVNGWG